MGSHPKRTLGSSQCMSLTNPEVSRSLHGMCLEVLTVDKRPIPHIQTAEPLDSVELEMNKVVKVGASLSKEAKQVLIQFL